MTTLAPEPAPSRPEPAAHAATSRARRVSVAESLMALAVLGAVTVAWFWPGLTAPVTANVGGSGDAYGSMWALGWIPFAIGHGMDPLVSHFVHFPGGVNLMWNTSMPLLGLLLSPVTVTAGVVASYNTLAVAGPALSSWAAYLAFRRWTGMVPAFLGALTFGFSPFVAAQSVDHPFLTFLFTAPLLLIVLDRLLVEQRAPAWRDGLWLGLLLAAQLLISEELLVMEAVAAAVGVVVLVILSPRQVPSRFRHALAGTVMGGCVAAALSAVPLMVQFLGPDRLNGNLHPSGIYVADLWNFVVPTQMSAWSSPSSLAVTLHFTGNYTEWGSFIGPPLLAFLVAAVLLCRRRKLAWVALAVSGVAAVLSLGPSLHVAGRVTGVTLPWNLLGGAPVLENLLPARFASMMFLGVALLVALGVEELHHCWRRWRMGLALRAAGYGLAGVGLLALAPVVPYPANADPPAAAFTLGLACPRLPGQDVTVLPSNDEATLYWQARAGYCFAQPARTGLNASHPTTSIPQPLLTAASAAAETGQRLPPVTPAVRAEVQSELRRERVVEIVVAPDAPNPAFPPAYRVATQDILDRLKLGDNVLGGFPPGTQARLGAWLSQVLGSAPTRAAGALIWHHLHVIPSPGTK
jgi:hypothetical protein